MLSPSDDPASISDIRRSRRGSAAPWPRSASAEFPANGGGVDGRGQRPELDAAIAEVVDDRGEVVDRAAERVDAPDGEGVPGPEEVQASDELRAGGGGAGGVVGERAHRASGGQCVVLQGWVLLKGGHPGVADHVQARRLAGAAHKRQGLVDSGR